MARKSRVNPAAIVASVAATCYLAGIYGRLSDDDGTSELENSIALGFGFRCGLYRFFTVLFIEHSAVRTEREYFNSVFSGKFFYFLCLSFVTKGHMQI